MIKIRLHGLAEDVEQAKEIIKETFNVRCESGLYKDRGQSSYVRCYMDCDVKEELSFREKLKRL